MFLAFLLIRLLAGCSWESSRDENEKFRLKVSLDGSILGASSTSLAACGDWRAISRRRAVLLLSNLVAQICPVQSSRGENCFARHRRRRRQEFSPLVSSCSLRRHSPTRVSLRADIATASRLGEAAAGFCAPWRNLSSDASCDPLWTRAALTTTRQTPNSKRRLRSLGGSRSIKPLDSSQAG